MPDNTEVYIKIATAVISAFIGYHRYMISLLNKKMDKEDCGRQQEVLAEKREKLELLITERTKTIFESLKEQREDLKIIKEHITKNGGQS